MEKTTRQGLQELQSVSLALNYSAEPLNATNRCISPRKGVGCSKSLSHWGSEYNFRKKASISGRVFVLGVDGKPLTPTTSSKAKKLLKGNVAKPIWNKFNQFGIQMLIETGKETPKTALGCDFGTKFEGYSIVVGKENNLNVMWKLPDKENLVRKLEERTRLRKTRRKRKCRRRPQRSNNRTKKGFIAPSQKMLVNSRLKCIREFFKYYPINYVALEDVKFNHKYKRWGKNFTTMELGKNFIKKEIEKLNALVFLYQGFDTKRLREEFEYKKSYIKNAEKLTAHCSDALALATDLTTKKHILYGKFIIVNDTYRQVRRKLHYINLLKGGIKQPYSNGNFRGIRKGTLCDLGTIAGGTEKAGRSKNYVYIYKWDNKRIGKSLNNIKWLSHNFKVKEYKKSKSKKRDITLAVEFLKERLKLYKENTKLSNNHYNNILVNINEAFEGIIKNRNS